MGKGSTWNSERIGHLEGARLEGAGVTEEGAETHHAPQNTPCMFIACLSCIFVILLNKFNSIQFNSIQQPLSC